MKSYSMNRSEYFALAREDLKTARKIRRDILILKYQLGHSKIEPRGYNRADRIKLLQKHFDKAMDSAKYHRSMASKLTSKTRRTR